jgi:peptidoglycan/LPS O-acetylase OafA/YrhL
MAQCFWPSAKPDFFSYLNVPSWSISCEWLFYLIAPAAIFLAFGLWRRWILVTGVFGYTAAMYVFLSHGQSMDSRLYFVSWFDFSRCIDFVIGIFIGLIFLRIDRKRLANLAGSCQVMGILCIVGGAFCRQSAPWPLWGGLLYMPGAALLVLGLAGDRGALVRHLGSPWLSRLGTASFSFYMIHVPIIRAIRGAFMMLHWTVYSWYLFWLITIVVFAFVQGMALLLCYRFEIPLQENLRQSLRARLSSQPREAGR